MIKKKILASNADMGCCGDRPLAFSPDLSVLVNLTKVIWRYNNCPIIFAEARELPGLHLCTRGDRPPPIVGL